MYDKKFFNDTLPQLAQEMKSHPGLQIVLVDGSAFEVSTMIKKEDEYFVAEIYPDQESGDKRKNTDELDRIVVPYDRIFSALLFVPKKKRRVDLGIQPK